jgi:hypothetical protein
VLYISLRDFSYLTIVKFISINNADEDDEDYVDESSQQQTKPRSTSKLNKMLKFLLFEMNVILMRCVWFGLLFCSTERARTSKGSRSDSISDGSEDSDFGDEDDHSETMLTVNDDTPRKRNKKVFTGTELVRKTEELIKKQKSFSKGAKKPLVLKHLPKNVKEEVRLVRKVEANIAAMKNDIESQGFDPDSFVEDDWNYNEEDYRTKKDPIRLADELPAGKNPRRITDLK